MGTHTADDYRERELKFDVPLDWELPDPAGLAPQEGSIERQTVRLETTYFDTADRDLLRSRITLRRRDGDSDAGWHLKLPAGDARTEVRLPPGGRTVPGELRDMTLGVRGGKALNVVATLVTEREIHRLLDDGRTPLAEIVVDTVTVLETRDVGVTRHWREVEVELLERGDERLLQRAARWLTKHGASPSASGSKLARALDADGSKPRDPAMLSALVAAYLDAQLDAILVGDVDLRRGREAVHATRVGTRRYRSVLRVLGRLFDAERAAALDVELKWFATGLGEVRDKQVLRKHLAEALAAVPDELVMGPVAARIHEALAADEAAAMSRLAAQMRTKRYYALLAELRAWRELPPVVADEPVANIAADIKATRRKAKRRIRHAPLGPGRDEALHRARKAAKRARYTAELARPDLGGRAKSVEKAMKAAQDRLGLRQDCVVAAEFLRRLGAAAGAAGENGFTYGLLYERELAQARDING